MSDFRPIPLPLPSDGAGAVGGVGSGSGAGPGSVDVDGVVPGYAVRWGVPSIVLGLVVFVAALALGAVLYVVGVLPSPSSAQFATSVLGYGVLFGLIVLITHRRGSGSLARDFGLRFRPIDLLLGLGAFVAAKLIAVFFASVAQRLAGDSPVQGNLTLDSDTVWIVLNAVLFAIFLGPLVEELFFRGLVLRAIRNRVLRRSPGAVDADGRVRAPARLARANGFAIILSAVIFAALHLYESSSWAAALAIGASTLALGLINGRIAVSTGRLGGGIVAHILFNGSSVLILLAATR